MRSPAADALLATAMRLFEAGKTDDAIATFERIVRLTPDQAAAHHNLGLACLRAGRFAPAAEAFDRAVKLKPTDADAFHNLGLALERLGRPREAIAAHRRAVAIKPRMAVAHHCLGVLLSGQGRRSEATQAYRRAAAVAPETLGGRLAKAQVLLAEERLGEAETCLRRALTLDPASPTPHWLLANLLSQSGRFEEADSCFRRAIDLDPTDLAVYRDYLTSKPLSEDGRPLLARMLDVIGSGNFVGQGRAELLFAIAKGHDDLGDRAAAMRYFDEANGLVRHFAPFDREAHARRVDAILAAFTPDLLGRCSGIGSRDERPLMILGMPRSGTTLVEQIISSHPDVAGAGELEFWNARASSFDERNMADAAAAVQALAAAYSRELDRLFPRARRITDKNPYNFLWIGLIKLAFPHSRIIHCRRHPVDTCLSIYTTPVATPTPYRSDRGDLVFYYRQYLRLMDHWRGLLPPGAILDVPYEALIAEPEAWSRRLVEFAGLEWDPACLRPQDNRRAIRTASLWQARQPIHGGSVERWRRYEPWLGDLRELLPDAG